MKFICISFSPQEGKRAIDKLFCPVWQRVHINFSSCPFFSCLFFDLFCFLYFKIFCDLVYSIFIKQRQSSVSFFLIIQNCISIQSETCSSQVDTWYVVSPLKLVPGMSSVLLSWYLVCRQSS
jgi:hypothetical protein